MFVVPVQIRAWKLVGRASAATVVGRCDGWGTDAMSQDLPLRKNRDYLLWWTGSAVSALGTGISSIAYPLLVLGATGSALKAAIVSAPASVALVILTLPAGVVADRYSRRGILIITRMVAAL